MNPFDRGADCRRSALDVASVGSRGVKAGKEVIGLQSTHLDLTSKWPFTSVRE